MRSAVKLPGGTEIQRGCAKASALVRGTNRQSSRWRGERLVRHPLGSAVGWKLGRAMLATILCFDAPASPDQDLPGWILRPRARALPASDEAVEDLERELVIERDPLVV